MSPSDAMASPTGARSRSISGMSGIDISPKSAIAPEIMPPSPPSMPVSSATHVKMAPPAATPAAVAATMPGDVREAVGLTATGSAVCPGFGCSLGLFMFCCPCWLSEATRSCAVRPGRAAPTATKRQSLDPGFGLRLSWPKIRPLPLRLVS